MSQMLEFNDVELYYDHVYALRGVTINLQEGETVALIGANGAGKSSILKAITGLARLDKGSIHFMGEQIDGLPASDVVNRGITMVPEGRRVFAYMSVKDNLMMGAFTRSDKADIQNTLDSILTRFPRLKERYSQAAGTLSGGEQQMLAIGRALMSAPKLLLMDEPSMGLAPVIVEEIAVIIEEINAQGLSVVLVEQNAELALELADHAYVLETGNMALEGPANELHDNDHVRAAYLGV